LVLITATRRNSGEEPASLVFEDSTNQLDENKSPEPFDIDGHLIKIRNYRHYRYRRNGEKKRCFVYTGYLRKHWKKKTFT